MVSFTVPTRDLSLHHIYAFLCASPIASQYGYGLRLLPYRAIRLRCYAIAPGKGQYAPRFGYLPAADTPHKSIHCVHIPKSINTSQFPTQMFAFQIHSNKINENLASNHFTSSCVEFLESICCTFAHIPTASPHPYFRRSNE